MFFFYLNTNWPIWQSFIYMLEPAVNTVLFSLCYNRIGLLFYYEKKIRQIPLIMMKKMTAKPEFCRLTMSTARATTAHAMTA